MSTETTNHPDAVCSLHGLPCHEPGEVLIERDALRSRLAAIEAAASAAVLAYGAHAHAQLRELFNESRAGDTLKALDELAEAMSKLDIALQAAPAAPQGEVEP